MKKQAVCEYCDKVFEDKTSEDYYNYKQDCVKHEITHLKLDEKFKENLRNALAQIDEKFSVQSNILTIDVSACWDDYYGKDITYEFEIENSKLESNIKSKIEVYYDEKEKIPTIDEITKLLEHHFFIPVINHKYEGIVTFEDFCGGDGADEFKVGDSYISTICKAFEGKKVRIEVIE